MDPKVDCSGDLARHPGQLALAYQLRETELYSDLSTSFRRFSKGRHDRNLSTWGQYVSKRASLQSPLTQRRASGEKISTSIEPSSGTAGACRYIGGVELFWKP